MNLQKCIFYYINNSIYYYRITIDNLKKLINYATKMPEKDEFLPGHKYPFNSCEILCSENGFNIDKLLKMKQLKKKDENINNDKKEENN